MMVPILEAVETFNGYGMEVVSGMILGLDTDTPDTGGQIWSSSSVEDPDADREPAAGAAAARRCGAVSSASGG